MVMYGLIQTVYDESKQTAFKNLYMDADSQDQFLLRAQLAQALKDSPKLIPSHGIDWILCTLTQHARNEEETVRVFQGIVKCLRHFSYGMLTDVMTWREMNDVADTCLVGVGFFRDHMERRHKLKAAPSVDYYSKMGALAYRRIGFEELGDHFNEWAEFIETELTL